MPAPLSIDDLLTMDDTRVTAMVAQRFTDRLRAVPEVHGVFFSGVPAPAPHPSAPGIRPLDGGWMKSIAVALVCAAVGRTAVRNFSDLVNRGRLNDFLNAQLASDSRAAIDAGGALYDAAFGDYAVSAGGNAFSRYLADRPERWGRELSGVARSPAFLNSVTIRFESLGQAAAVRLLNTAAYLVRRLVPEEADAVSAAFRERLPAIFTPAGYSLLQRADFTETLFLNEVTAVASVERTLPRPFMPPPRPPAPVTTTVVFGEALMDFLNREAGAFRTGVRPNDRETRSPFSCFLRGTRIRLADGAEVPIETLSGGERLLAADGATSLCSGEEAERVLEQEAVAYGVNALAPFFTAGHMLMTAEGWKAVDPAIPKLINPHLEVGTLAVGDRLVRLVSSAPFRVEHMEVERITQAPIDAGASLFALVLDGPQSYFADGLCVAANYPALTEVRIAGGIAALPDAERRALVSALRPVLPLVLEMLRGFAGPRLEALLASGPAEEDKS